MKLFEVLSKRHPNIPQASKDPMDPLHPPSWDYIEGGQQSLVYSTKHPNVVVKVAYTKTGTQDPTYQFLRVILNHQDNPYFPKVYHVKQYPSYLIITMEKLSPMTNADYPLLQQTVGSISLSEFEQIFHDSTKLKQLIKTTNDPELRQALRLMAPLFQHYDPDMNPGNIMIRPTPRHIVFIDPIAYE